MPKIKNDNIDNFYAYGLNSKTRVIELVSDVDEHSVSEVIRGLQILDAENNQPIKLYINSFGGSVYDGLGLIDAIMNCKSEVITIGQGKIMSMATYILMAGDHRYMTAHSTLMFHEVSAWEAGQLTDMKIELKEAERLEKLLIDFSMERTKMKKRRFWNNFKKATYFGVEKGIEYGIVDGVWTNEE